MNFRQWRRRLKKDWRLKFVLSSILLVYFIHLLYKNPLKKEGQFMNMSVSVAAHARQRSMTSTRRQPAGSQIHFGQRPSDGGSPSATLKTPNWLQTLMGLLQKIKNLKGGKAPDMPASTKPADYNCWKPVFIQDQKDRMPDIRVEDYDPHLDFPYPSCD
jgi:hypothetical protein